MNKKLLAVAVAGALAAPGVALAQASSVTISGFFKVGWENLNYSNSGGTAANVRNNSSQNRIVDNSSRIIFNSVEALGNGLSAVGQLDIRFAPDQASQIQTSNPIGSGNTFVGLKSTSWGMLTLGRWDLHYGKGPSEMTRGAGALQASDVSLFDYIGPSPIANATRTQNVVKYDTPVWGGFSGTLAWSANPGGNSDLDMLNRTAAVGQQSIAGGAIPGSAGIGGALTAATVPGGPGMTTRKGDAWNINPRYSNGPFEIEYSYWRAKPDAPSAATNDQRGDSLTGKFSFGGFKVGLGANKSKLENANTGILFQERTTWSLAGQYKTGPHSIYAHYDRAGSVSSNTAGVATADTRSKMFAIAYEYSLSKRTSLAATYAQINNDANANYNFFTSSSLGSTDAVTVAGEKPRLVQLSILHAF